MVNLEPCKLCGSPAFIEMFKRLGKEGTICMDVPAYGVYIME